MISKHVEEILEIFRNHYRNIYCVEAQYKTFIKLGVDYTNLYPEDTNSNKIFELSNNKNITIDDLEFAEMKTINGKETIFLGNYRFYFSTDTFGI